MKSARELAKECAWDLSNDPSPDNPKNKDFIEADLSKIEQKILEYHSNKLSLFINSLFKLKKEMNDIIEKLLDNR